MSLSVIIPTHNRPDLLQRALNSVLKQTVLPSEIIVIDDCSTETNYIFIKSPLVNVIYSNVSLGGAKARNLGVENSSSDFIMFLDDDDAWEPTKVESQLALIAKENVSIVYSGKKVVIDDELDKVIRLITPLSDSITFSSLCSCNYIGSTSSVVIKRKDFENSGGFDISLKCFQDYDLWLRLLKYGIAISDGKTNVIYTVFKKKNMQISRSTDGRHIIAGEYLQLKYKSIMTDKEMKLFTANLYQLVSKASNHSKPITSLKFAILSLYIKPSLRGIKFLAASLLSLLGYKHV